MTQPDQAPSPAILTAGTAFTACVPLESCLTEHLGEAGRQAVLVALADPVAAAVAIYGLPRLMPVAPVRWDMSSHEAGNVLVRLDPAVLVTDRPDSLLAKAASTHGLPVVVLSNRELAASQGTRLQLDIEWRKAQPRVPRGRSYPTGTAIILQTSGTTGDPKIVALTRSNLAGSVDNVIRSLGLGPQDRSLTMMPLTHIHGIVAVLHAALEAGGTLTATPQLDPGALWRCAPDLRPTWFSVVPTLLDAICSDRPTDGSRRGLENLRFVRTASSSLPPSLRARAESLFAVPVLEAYGMTEACHQVSSNTLAANRPGSVGQAGPEPEVSIRDASGTPVPPGAAGEICLRGENLFSGYVVPAAKPGRPGNPQADAASHWSNWFHTGDLGRIDADGYLWITGRIKEQINRGGETLSPVEIEDALLLVPGVRSAVAFPVPHPSLGEEVAALCVLDEGDTRSDSDLITEVSARLSFHKLPKRIVLADALPTSTVSGKVSRLALSAQYGDLFGTPPDVSSSRSPIRSAASEMPRDSPPRPEVDRATLADTIQDIYRSVLNLQASDPEQSFFALGGTSLQAARIMAAIHDRLGIDLPLATIVAHPSAAAMSRVVAAAVARPSFRLEDRQGEVHPTAGGVLLPVSLTELYIAQAIDPRRDDLCQMFVVEFSDAVLPAEVERALAAMAGSHGALRSAVQHSKHERLAFVETGATDVRIVEFAEIVDRWSDSAALPAFLHEPLPLGRSPLLRVVAQPLSGGRLAYAFKVSELILDGYSRILFIAELAAHLHAVPLAREQDRFAAITARMAARQLPAPDPGNAAVAGRVSIDLSGEPGLAAARIERQLEQTSWNDVERLAHRCGATPFAVMLSLFALVLDRVSGEPVDILVAVQRRTLPEEYGTIGNFAERIPIRIPTEPTHSFADVARSTTARLLTGLQESAHHVIGSGERAVMFEIEDELDLFTSHDATPLTSEGSILDQLNAMRIDPVYPSRTAAALALAISPRGAYGRPGPPRAILTYDPALISAGRASAVLDAVLNLLARAIADPDTTLGTMPLIASGAPTPFVAEAPRKPHPLTPLTARRLETLFAHSLEHAPDAPAVVVGGESLSFSKINELASRIATAFSDVAVAAGQPIAFWDGRAASAGHDPGAGWSPLYAIVGLAILRRECVVVPIGRGVPDVQMATMLIQGGIATIASNESVLPAIVQDRFRRAATIWTPCGEVHLFGAIGGNSGPRFTPDAAYLMHSSGTTGVPKAILQSHRSLIDVVECVLELGLWPDSGALPGNDVGFDVFTAVLWLTWAQRRALHAPDRFDFSPSALRRLADAGVRSFTTSPTVASTLIKEDPNCFRAFDLVTLTGEELPLSLAEMILAHAGRTRVANLYGPTESTVWASGEVIRSPIGPRVSIGGALKNYRIEIAEPRTLLPMLHDLPGEILIATPSPPLGYAGNPGANRDAFVDRPTPDGPRTFYRTGDIGWIDGSGRLHYAGRKDRQVQMSGIRVEPGGVEAIMAGVEGVGQAAVVDVATPSGPYLVAFLVPNNPLVKADDLSRRAIKAAELRLAAAAVPRVVKVVERLPQSRSGKVDLAALRDQAKALPVPVGPRRPVLPGTLEAEIATIWRELLGRSELFLTNEFQKSGGTSLGIMRLATRLTDTFGVDIAVAELFVENSIAAQADLVRSRRTAVGEPAAGAIPGPGKHGPRLKLIGLSSSSRQRPWIIGMPMKDGTSNGLGPLDNVLHDDCDFGFIEVTRKGQPVFEQAEAMVLAEEICTLVRARMSERSSAPIFCGYSIGGWLAWFVERFWVSRYEGEAPRVLNFDAGPLHLVRPDLLRPETHDCIRQAEAIRGTEMLVIGRDDSAAVPFVRPSRWREMSGRILFSPRVQSISHLDIPERQVVAAAAPFVRQWIAGEDPGAWPRFLPIPPTSQGQLLYDLFCGHRLDPLDTYARLKAEFLQPDEFNPRTPIFELLALKRGDLATGFELAKRHAARDPTNRYALLKWLAVLVLRGERDQAQCLAAAWTADHPDDALPAMVAAGGIDLRAPVNPPAGKLFVDFGWWRYLLAAALRLRPTKPE